MLCSTHFTGENYTSKDYTKNTIDYNNTVSLLSFHKMQPDYIYCKYIIYIAFDNSNRYYLSFGIKFMRVWMFFVQEEKLRGVSVWNVRETGDQESQLSRS